MARRLAIDQLLSCRAINQIEEMTDADLARIALPSPSATDTCTACEDDLEATKAWQAPCEHWYCFDCLGILLRVSMEDESVYPPRCCDVLPWQEIKWLLPKDLAISFGRKGAEFDTPAGERVYCAQPACSHFLGGTATLARSVMCSLCHSNTCTLCSSRVSRRALRSPAKRGRTTDPPASQRARLAKLPAVQANRRPDPGRLQPHDLPLRAPVLLRLWPALEDMSLPCSERWKCRQRRTP
jgi:hypothetical protein